MTEIRTCLWFTDKAEEAARFYVSLFPNSRIETVVSLSAAVSASGAKLVEFRLADTPYQAFDGGPHFSFNEAASITVATEDQAETDRLWAALTADGGQESLCGWLKDRYGLSWQIVPNALRRALAGDDQAGTTRAMQAMLTMKKIDVAAIEKAYRGEE